MIHNIKESYISLPRGLFKVRAIKNLHKKLYNVYLEGYLGAPKRLSIVRAIKNLHKGLHKVYFEGYQGKHIGGYLL